jgi:hypothetical protein
MWRIGCLTVIAVVMIAAVAFVVFTFLIPGNVGNSGP